MFLYTYRKPFWDGYSLPLPIECSGGIISIGDTKIDEIVKSRKTPFFVIPAKAGIQFFQLVTEFLDSGFHWSDDFLRMHQN
jgi:hypothetical protein